MSGSVLSSKKDASQEAPPRLRVARVRELRTFYEAIDMALMVLPGAGPQLTDTISTLYRLKERIGNAIHLAEQTAALTKKKG